MAVCMKVPNAVKVYLDIAPYWPKDNNDEPVSVNSVYVSLLNTPNELGRNTLRLALDGKLDRGHFSNQVKLARLASHWSGKQVTILELLRIEE